VISFSTVLFKGSNYFKIKKSVKIYIWNTLLSGTLKIERLESQIIKVLGAIQPKAERALTGKPKSAKITYA